jgi:hypothetical protein
VRFRFFPAALLSAAALAGCQTTTAETEGQSAIKPTTPPEFMPCAALPETLAYADAVVRRLASSDKSSEAQFWRERQRRLVARAYECKR